MGETALVRNAIAQTAIVDPSARIGKGTKIWNYAQIAEHAVVGDDCVIGNGVYIDRYVQVGNHVRIHNKALIYHGVVVEDDVFIGPGVCFANDPIPRTDKTRNLAGKSWKVAQGAAIGANATILPDVSIGAHAVVGAGSVVTKSVPAYTVVCGNPARPLGLVCVCGHIQKGESVFLRLATDSHIPCPHCNYKIPALDKEYFQHLKPAGA